VHHCQLLASHRFPTRTEARVAVFDSLEGFDTPRRRRFGLGQLSPADSEPSHQAQHASAQP